MLQVVGHQRQAVNEGRGRDKEVDRRQARHLAGQSCPDGGRPVSHVLIDNHHADLLEDRPVALLVPGRRPGVKEPQFQRHHGCSRDVEAPLVLHGGIRNPLRSADPVLARIPIKEETHDGSGSGSFTGLPTNSDMICS